MTYMPPTYCVFPGLGFCPDILSDMLAGHSRVIARPNLVLNKDMSSMRLKKIGASLPTRATYIGWSMGGLNAILVAKHFPKHIDKIVLINSQPYMMADNPWSGILPQQIDTLTTLLDNPKTEASAISLFLSLVNYPNRQHHLKQQLERYFDIVSPTEFKQQMTRLISTDLRDDYARLTLPILHIVGDDDVVLPPNHRQLQSLNSNVTVVSLPKMGHGGVVTHSKLINSHINAFNNE